MHQIEILEYCASRAELKIREKELITFELIQDQKCMNLTIGGEGGPTNLGKTNSEQSKERVRLALLGHPVSDETRQKIGLKSKGRGKGEKLSAEHRQKIADAKKGQPSPLKGCPRPAEVVAKIKQSHQLRSHLNPRPKKPMPEKVPAELVSQKLSEAATRQWVQPGMKQKMTEAHREANRKRAIDPTTLTFYCDDMRHLVCLPYSKPALHAMARHLGIGRHFYHKGSYLHYDIPKRRIAEIQARCTVVSGREILKICKGERT